MREPQLVITLDIVSMVAAYEPQIEHCKFNSGFAQPHNKKLRNRASFLPIADYPHPQRTVANPRGEDQPRYGPTYYVEPSRCAT
jgi:hypothetical protein